MQPKLKVIQGDWVSSPKWLEFPKTVIARSPFFGLDLRPVRIARADVFRAAEIRRRTPAYVLWSTLLGAPPPVPHEIKNAEAGLTSLKDAYACFQGVQRPFAEDKTGTDVVAYVLKPKWVFGYEAKPPLMLATKEPVADDLVLVAYVRLDRPVRANGIFGVLTHWHFVEADPLDRLLPIGYEQRYGARLW